MKALSILVLAIGLVSSFAGAATLDLDKFAKKCEVQLGELIGNGNITGDREIIFTDGAGAIDDPPAYDYAAYIYLVTVNKGLLPGRDLRLGYRVHLNGQEDVVLVSQEKDQMAIAFGGSGAAVLSSEVQKEQVEDLINNLTKIAPDGQFKYLDAIGILLFEVPLLKHVQISEELTNSGIVQAIELDHETYRHEFQFDPIVKVTERGIIDPDKYRDLTRRLKAAGLVFTSATRVPDDLR